MPPPTVLDTTLHFIEMQRSLERAVRAGLPTQDHWRLVISAYLLQEATILTAAVGEKRE